MSDDSSDLSGGEEELPPEASTVDSIVEQVVTLVIAVAIALLIRQLLIEPFRIPSGSMYPTLLMGDHLFVNKLSYGPRIPFTDLRLPGLGEPERGDIVVFEVARPMQRGKPDTMAVDRAPAGSRREDFVKRLVGLPGDEISWRHGQVFVNGEPLAMARVPEGWTDSASGMHCDRSQEDLGALQLHLVEEGGRHGPVLLGDTAQVRATHDAAQVAAEGALQVDHGGSGHGRERCRSGRGHRREHATMGGYELPCERSSSVMSMAVPMSSRASSRRRLQIA